jgi:hypothetical protein
MQLEREIERRLLQGTAHLWTWDDRGARAASLPPGCLVEAGRLCRGRGSTAVDDIRYSPLRVRAPHAGWFGQENGQTLTLPYFHSDYLSIYLVHTAGWFAGLLLLGSMGVLLYSVYRAERQIRHTFGRGLARFIAVLAGAHFLLAQGGLFGLVPMNGLDLPPFGYGGTRMLLWMSLFGLFSGIYRRKDMLPQTS